MQSLIPTDGTEGRKTKERMAVVLAWACVALVIAAWHLHFGFLQYGGFDGGILVNTAWQQYLGAEPYRDFFTPTPPLFVFPAGWAFELFGPSWRSLIILLIIFSVATFTWTALLFRKAGVGDVPSLILAFFTQAMTTMTFSWWWYNQVTAVVALIFVASSFVLLMHPRDFLVRASFGAAEFLLGLAKTNEAGPLLMVFVAVLLWERTTRKFVLMATVTSALAAVAFLGWHGVSVPLLLRNYLGLADRLWNLDAWSGAFMADLDVPVHQASLPGIIVLLAAPLLLLLSLMRSGMKSPSPRVVFALGFMTSVSAVLGMSFNRDLKLIEVTSCLVAVVMIDRFLRQAGALVRFKVMPWVMIAALALVSIGLTVGALRLRVFSCGEGRYAQKGPLIRLEEPAFFQGMEVGPIFDDTLRDAGQALAEEGWPGHRNLKIFIGPRIDCCYAVFGVPVQPGLPIWWEKIPSSHHGENIPDGDDSAIDYGLSSHWIPDGEPLDPRVQRFIDTKFDLCVFCLTPEGIPNMTLMPPDLRAELYDHYRVKRHGTVAIFTRIPGT